MDSLNLVIGMMVTAAHEKYREEIRACERTWIKDAKMKRIRVVLLGGYQKSDEFDLVNLPGVNEDYQSAFYKQFYGIEYIQKTYNPDYQLIIGSDTYLNIEALINLLKQHETVSELYLGGHGDVDILTNNQFIFMVVALGLFLIEK